MALFSPFEIALVCFGAPELKLIWHPSFMWSWLDPAFLFFKWLFALTVYNHGNHPHSHAWTQLAWIKYNGNNILSLFPPHSSNDIISLYPFFFLQRTNWHHRNVYSGPFLSSLMKTHFGKRKKVYTQWRERSYFLTLFWHLRFIFFHVIANEEKWSVIVSGVTFGQKYDLGNYAVRLTIWCLSV